jgi:glutathione peroxidase-family protein
MIRIALLGLAALALVFQHGCSNASAGRNTSATTNTATTTTTTTAMTIPTSFYDFKLPDIAGTEQSLAQYRGKVVVVVNTASECGYTPQYADLQTFYTQFKDKNVVVLGFPANNFGGQEPGTNAQIQQFCTSRFNVTFPMFGKISVNGDDCHPLYQFLTQKQYNGNIDATVGWNFNKFVIDKTGKVVKHFGSRTKPTDAEFTQFINTLL